MVYLITDNGVIVARNKKDASSKMEGVLDDAELIALGPDYVAKLTERDIDFIQDKKRMSAIMFGNFFKKDNSIKLFVIVNLVFTFLILVLK